ncbi:hypothetical protein [uncultured Clostridium sp.]|uniref:hypothetical protein n=1 Tax=uncultured Clostridium sp. TaxID=59620 RepID=UPI0026F107E0|nr:hypothetical protein [uncultured Clostridium sp.]
MFLRKDIKQIQKGTLLVPFCKSCNSQNIETIQVCKDCGSHNVTSDWTDKRSQRLEFAELEVSIYKCDKCGKEYESRIDDNTISYDGEFNPYSCHDDDYGNYGYTNYNLSVDLCKDCKQKIVDKLNAKISKITSDSYIRELTESFMEE